MPATSGHLQTDVSATDFSSIGRYVMKALESVRRNTRSVAALGAAVAVVATAQVAIAGHADAATTNDTVMVTTQRMSSDTLNSAQVGTYGAGSHLSLACYARGESVTGYYSRYIPGRYDNLWYQVSDGYWVADVDINTGSNNPVVPACKTAQVMATTQEMSSDTLVSAQAGWYNKGRLLGLSCYARGESVTGYYSPYIPGRYDNLWYQTTDGHWVADVDINTGSNNPITGPCTTSPTPPPTSTKAQKAVSWALSRVGSQSYNFACETFVENAYGTRGRYASAIAGYNALRAAGQIHGGTAPAGALVFSSAPAYDEGFGHVDIAVGNGTYVSGGVLPAYRGLKGAGSTVQLMNTWNPSPGAQNLGWAYAPTSWPGV